MEDNLKEQNSIFDLDGCIANFNFFINSIKIRLLGILVMFLILFYVYLFIYADIWNKLVEYISSDSTATLIKSCIIILADFLMLPLHSINITKRLNHITGKSIMGIRLKRLTVKR